MTAKPKYVFTLVHGTFANNAPWTQESSLLRQKLTAAFVDADVRFEPFNWGGTNSHRARLEGGTKLGAHIVRVSTTSKGARHYVIAHSHGGNVALYALRHVPPASHPDGIITMATPFMHCAPRDIEASFAFFRLAIPAWTWFICLMLSVLLGALGGALTAHVFDVEPGGLELFLILAFALPGIIFLPPFLVPWAHRIVAGPLRVWAQATQAKILDRLRSAAQCDVPLLCLTVEWDEAGIGLGLQQQLAATPFRLWRRSLFTAVTVAVAGHLLWLGGWPWPDSPGTDSPVEGIFMALAYGAIIATAGACILQGAMALLPKLRTHPLGFGPESILDNWLINLTVAPQPAGVWPSLACLTPFRISGRAGLRHSALYDLPDALKVMVGWIHRTHDESFCTPQPPLSDGQ